MMLILLNSRALQLFDRQAPTFQHDGSFPHIAHIFLKIMRPHFIFLSDAGRHDSISFRPDI